jgi:hypothetical protein
MRMKHPMQRIKFRRYKLWKWIVKKSLVLAALIVTKVGVSTTIVKEQLKTELEYSRWKVVMR